MLMTKSSLRNTLLIAMPTMSDPYFSGSVIYLCGHDEAGAMGLIINQPLDVPLFDLFRQTGIACNASTLHFDNILFGGPVDIERGFVLHTHEGVLEDSSSILVSPDIALTSSHEILIAIGNNSGPATYLVALGYAGWGPGQLEKELVSNVWLNSPADKSILFSTPFDQRFAQACARIGVVDPALLSHETGHA